MSSVAPQTGLPFSLPAQYRILPRSVRLTLPGFDRDNAGGGWTLAFTDTPCDEWFNQFVDRVIDACGRRYLPVCRMSDGEYRFVLGGQPPSSRIPVLERASVLTRQLISTAIHRGGFRANTRPWISSGQYSRAERSRGKRLYTEYLRRIATDGILALHLSFGPQPFQEHYFPALKRWIDRNEIQLHAGNYVPFYFVYAMLTGPRRHDLLEGRRVLVVHSAMGDRRARIVRALTSQGAVVADWCPISPARSFFDQIDPRYLRSEVDLVLVGAGVGKPNVLLQFAELNVPCIDAGYVFEVWADPSCARLRPFCDSND